MMKVTLELKPENYQIFQDLDDDDKSSLIEMFNNLIKSRHLLGKKSLENLTEPTIYRKAGSAEGLIKMSDDFDEPLDDFKDYM